MRVSPRDHSVKMIRKQARRKISLPWSNCVIHVLIGYSVWMGTRDGVLMLTSQSMNILGWHSPFNLELKCKIVVIDGVEDTKN